MNYFGVEMPGKFTEFGSMLMQGMVNGITNGLAAVKDSITGAADSTITWFKEKLGIHSPSRVFASLGGFTMAGLVQGLAGGEGDVLGQISSTARRLTEAGASVLSGGFSFDSRPPVASAGGGALARGGDTYSITIHAAPGMDPQAIAREVRAELARQKAAGAARTRSRLTDSE